MKKIFILIIGSSLFGSSSFSQNVGIGTATPFFKLDVRGSVNADSGYRIGGTNVLATKGSTNTFVGQNNGLANLTGSNNTAVGALGLSFNTTGSDNTALGTYALFSNINGRDNTALGADAMHYNNSGYENTAVGRYALYGNGNGFWNTAVGFGALYYNNQGFGNTAVGITALHDNSNGGNNTAIGRGAMYRTNIGSHNVGIGYYALVFNYTGDRNVAVGCNSLGNTQYAEGNIAVGDHAGDWYDNGYFNTFLGADSRTNNHGYYNSIAIGNSATVTAPLQARIGSSVVTSIGGYANWTNMSDGRFKKNINENVSGIDFIMKLRPVTYNLDISGISNKLDERRGREMNKQTSAAITDKENIFYSGFIAQEVEQAAKAAGYDFSGVDKPKNATDLYGLRYAEFVVPLVKAVQEQQAQIETLKKEVEMLRGK